MDKRARWLSFCLLMFGCQDLDVEKAEGEPCTRTDQCEDGLVCLAGVCLEDSGAALDPSFDEAPELEAEPSDGF